MGGAWYDHGADGFVGFEKVFCKLFRDGDEVGLEVFRIADNERWVDYC